MVIRKAQALIKVVTNDLDIQEFLTEFGDYDQYLESEVDDWIFEKSCEV